MSPRRANPDAHESLLEAAREEFARHGVDGARVEDIARRAGVSKGAFYLHFRTKEGAFKEILQRLLGVLADQAARREDSVGAPSRAANLAAVIARECACDAELLEALWRNRMILAAVESAATGSAAALVMDFRRRMRTLVSGRIGERQRDGTLRADLAPDVLGDVIMGAYEAFVRRMIDCREKPDLAAWARVFQSAFYLGALAPAARSALAPRASDS